MEFFRLNRDQIDLKEGSPIRCPMMDLALRYESGVDGLSDIHVL